jgi:hypothetical protein
LNLADLNHSQLAKHLGVLAQDGTGQINQLSRMRIIV